MTKRSGRLKMRLLVWLMPGLLLLQISSNVYAVHSRKRSSPPTRRSNSYDRSITTLDPSGRLRQLEYSRVAAARGSTAVAIAIQGVVFVLAKNVVHRIDEHTWFVATGLQGDARAMASHLRIQSQNHLLQTGEASKATETAQVSADLAHSLTYTAGARPFGIQGVILNTGSVHNGQRIVDADNPELFYRYYALGRDRERVLERLEKSYESLCRCSHEADVVKELLELFLMDLVDRNDNSTMNVWILRQSSSGKSEPLCLTNVTATPTSLARVRRHLKGLA